MIRERRCVGGGSGGQKGGGGSKGEVGGTGGERARAEESRSGGTGESVRGGYEGEGNGHLLHWTQATLCYEILKFNISENIKETHSPARLLQRPAQATRLPGCCDLLAPPRPNIIHDRRCGIKFGETIGQRTPIIHTSHTHTYQKYIELREVFSAYYLWLPFSLNGCCGYFLWLRIVKRAMSGDTCSVLACRVTRLTPHYHTSQASALQQS